MAINNDRGEDISSDYPFLDLPTDSIGDGATIPDPDLYPELVGHFPIPDPEWFSSFGDYSRVTYFNDNPIFMMNTGYRKIVFEHRFSVSNTLAYVPVGDPAPSDVAPFIYNSVQYPNPNGLDSWAISIVSRSFSFDHYFGGKDYYSHILSAHYVFVRTYQEDNLPILPPIYEWDPETEVIIDVPIIDPPIEDGCINISGPSNLLCNNIYIYTAAIIGSPEECEGSSDCSRIVYISYVGSNVNYNGPATVIIPAGHSYINFNIYIPDNQTGILIVSSDSINNDTCTEQKSTVSCNGDGGGFPGDGDSSTPCSTIGFFWEPYGHKTKLPSYML